MENIITVNGKEYPLPEDAKLDTAVKLYSDIAEGDTYFVRLNGKTVNSIIDGTDQLLAPGDVLDVFPLIIGG